MNASDFWVLESTFAWPTARPEARFRLKQLFYRDVETSPKYRKYPPGTLREIKTTGGKFNSVTPTRCGLKKAFGDLLGCSISEEFQAPRRELVFSEADRKQK